MFSHRLSNRPEVATVQPVYNNEEDTTGKGPLFIHSKFESRNVEKVFLLYEKKFKTNRRIRNLFSVI